MRRAPTAALASATAVVLAAIVVAARGLGGGEPTSPAAAGLPPATAQVTRQTLTQTERLAGTLGHGPTATLIARTPAAPTLPASPEEPTTNTITWLPPVGSVIRPGETVYKVDNRPVPLLAGDLPLYRRLAGGAKGPDVRLIEENLTALGYKGITVDESFTASTVTAVKRWQKDLGVPQTGTIDVHQVAVAPGEIRVSAHRLRPGADATGEVLTYTGTVRLVTVPLDVTRQHLVRKGLTATVNLPGGGRVTGTVESIGTVAQPAGEAGGGPPTVEVLVSLADQAALGTLDSAPVDMTLVVAEHQDVLTVPVAALVALAEGGFGVQVVTGSTSSYRAVRTGMFAAGRVEISGEGITEGTVVGVPA